MKNHIEDYRHFGKCICLTNEFIELKIPLSFGIRIIYCSLKGERNIFYEQPVDADYLKNENGWRIYGGHRLWLAPESDKTYYPDNEEISYHTGSNSVRFEQPADSYLDVIKSLEIRFPDTDPSLIELEHTVRNIGDKDLYTGLWTISAMAPGSVAEIPFSGFESGYSPGRYISLWGETDLSDPRFDINPEYIKFKHLPLDNYSKIGLWNRDGTASCITNGQKLDKRIQVFNDRKYPDNNVNFEFYQCRHMLEFEILSPLMNIKPGEVATFKEQWQVSLARENIHTDGVKK